MCILIGGGPRWCSGRWIERVGEEVGSVRGVVRREEEEEEEEKEGDWTSGGVVVAEVEVEGEWNLPCSEREEEEGELRSVFLSHPSLPPPPPPPPPTALLVDSVDSSLSLRTREPRLGRLGLRDSGLVFRS